MNGHCAYSFSGGIYRIEYNTLWGVEAASFPPQANAAYVHLYGIGHAEVDYILETFPIIKREDEQAHGEYRTKRVILAIYDAMQQVIEAGNHITCASTHPCIRLDTAGNHAGGGNGTTYKKA